MQVQLSCWLPTPMWETESILNPSQYQKIMFGVLGMMFVAIGVAGIALPGVPTTGPLLAASFCLAKCNKELERKIVRNSFFKKYLSYFEKDAQIPMKARLWAMFWMWSSIGGSLFLLQRRNPAWMVFAAMLGAGLVGSLCIFAIRNPSLVLPWLDQKDSTKPNGGTSEIVVHDDPHRFLLEEINSCREVIESVRMDSSEGPLNTNFPPKQNKKGCLASEQPSFEEVSFTERIVLS